MYGVAVRRVSYWSRSSLTTLGEFQVFQRNVGATAMLPTNGMGEGGCHLRLPLNVVVGQGRYRYFSDVAGGTDSTVVHAASMRLSTPKLDELYGEITELSEEEVNMLGALVIQVLGRKIFPGEFGRGGEVGIAIAGGGDNDVPEEVEVKTKFGVKLVGYDAQSKIKVIKQVRAIAGLGLKEAKDLVESVPKFIAKDLSSEKAEELKAQFEAVGAQIEID